jgi:hypothetical protein
VKLLRFLFPNGIGTRAILAFVVVGTAVALISPEKLYELALLAMGYYFGSRDSATKSSA